MATLSASHTENTAFREMVAHYWRDWQRYLQANHTLVLGRQDGTGTEALFERSGTTPTQQATLDLAAIPPDRRALFERFYTERREEVQCELEATERAAHPGVYPTQIDPDELSRTTLERLIDQAEGRSDQSGWGIVPLPDNTYRVHVAELLGQPSAELYQMRAPTDEKRRAMLGVIGLILAMLAVLGWWFTRAPQQAARVAEEQPNPVANNIQLEPWPISRVILHDSEMPIATLAVQQIKSEEWPQQPQGQAFAYLRSANLPLTMCAPQELLARSSQAQLPGSGLLPDRIYTLRPADSGPHDLRLVACENSSGTVYYGMLQATQALASHTLGEQVQLPGGPSLRVQSISLVGPGQNAAIPSNQAWVTVQVSITQPITGEVAFDWPQYAPSLLLADGTTTLPSQVVEEHQQALLTYLIPLPTAPTAVAWTITPPRAERSFRWRTTVAPAPDRAILLSTALTVEARSQAEPDQIILTLENRSTSPLQLSAADIILAEGTTRLALTEPVELQQPLAPGERRVVALTIQHSGTQPLLLTIGTARYQLSK